MFKSHYAGSYLILFDYFRKIHIWGKSPLRYEHCFILDGVKTNNQKISTS